MAFLDFLPDYSNKPVQSNPYFLGGAGLIVAGLWVYMRQTRADNIAADLGPAASAAPPADPGDPNAPLSLFKSNLTPAEAEAFKRVLPEVGQKYADFFVRAGRAAKVSPFIMAGISSRESGLGAACKTPACRGYKVVAGHGDYGIMQINSKAHPAFFAKTVNGSPAYEDPWSSIEYGTNLFASYRKFLRSKFPSMSELELLRATASAYNAGHGRVAEAIAKGKSPDSVTTGYDYGKNVMERATKFLAATRVA